MKRLTMASTVAASPGLKKYQPSGLTGLGGSPAKGDQGTVPERLLPSAVPARIGKAATDASKRRRLSPRDDFFISIPSDLRWLKSQLRPPPLLCASRKGEADLCLAPVILLLVGG